MRQGQISKFNSTQLKVKIEMRKKKDDEKNQVN